MGYCRFRNTITDLQDCDENMYEEASKDEARCRKELIKLCKSIASDFKDEEDIDSLPTEE